jgi:nitrogenase molybdenum-iron protein alpha chain
VPNFVPYFSSLADLRNMVNARLSLTTCGAYGDDLVEYLQARHEIPYLRAVLPVGTSETDKWIRGIAAAVGKSGEGERLIERERRRWLPKIEEIREQIQGSRVLIINNLMRGISNLSLSRDFGLEVVALQSVLYNDYYSEELKGAINTDVPFTFNGAQGYETVNLAKKMDVDLFLGMGGDQQRRAGIPAVSNVDRLKLTVGYPGAVTLGRKFADALDNRNFTEKLGKRETLPYRKSWFAENPFKYVVPSGGES